MDKELVLVDDFGGHYNQLIARRVRECGVYCEIIPDTYTVEQIKEKNPKGIIFTGGQTAKEDAVKRRSPVRWRPVQQQQKYLSRR